MALYDVSLTGGVDGKSAYQYAVEAGYEGTEEEFAQLLNEIDNLSSDASRITYNDTTVKDELDNINAELDNVLPSANTYTDTKVADLVGSAPETLNTLEEVAQAINDNEDVVTALNSAIGNKANQSDLEALQGTVNNKANQSDLETLQGTVSTNEAALNTHTSSTSNPHNVTKEQLGLGEVDNTSDVNKPVSTAQQEAIDNAVTESKDYTDTKVSDLMGSAPETLNTLEKVAQVINDNGDAIETLNNTIETKANQSDLEALQGTVTTNETALNTHTSNTDNPHSVTKAQVGLSEVDNTSDLNKPVSTATQTAINNSLSESKGYTDTKVADLVGSAPETLDTLEEVAQAIEENEDVVTALNSAIGNKANQSDLNDVIERVSANEETLSSFEIATEESIDNIINSLI